MLNVQIDHNFGILKNVFKTASQVAVKKAVVQSMNRAAVTGRKEASRIIGKTINLPQGGRSSKGGGGLTPPGIKSMIEINKAKYQRSVPIASHFATINSSNKPISLIHFVVGPKAPRSQKGIPVAQRQKLQVKITRDRKLVLNKAFIAKSRRGGAVQVYRRDHADKMRKQSIKGIYRWFEKPEIINPVRSIISSRYRAELPRQLAYYMSQIRAPRKK